MDDDYTAAFEPSDADSDEMNDEDEDEELEGDEFEEGDSDAFMGDGAALEGLAEEHDSDEDIELEDDDDVEVPAKSMRSGSAKKSKKVSFGSLPQQESEKEVRRLVKNGSKAPKGGKRGRRR